MNNYDRVQFDALREDFSRNCTSVTEDLAYLLNEDSLGRINTKMDIQRKYVWTADREQEMWDTLLFNVRIPEFHAIMSGRVRNICDGKQRLTCIFKILRDQIAYNRSTSKPECLWLFQYVADQKKKKSLPFKIYFSELPKDIQDNILNKTLLINRYENLTREEEIALFRKINNGMALSDFSRGMASYYYMRHEFTDPIMNDSNLTKVTNLISNDEYLETVLIRALILCDHFDSDVNLQPNNLEKFYDDYKDEKVIKTWLNTFCILLDRFPNIETLFLGRSWRTITPFIIEGVYKHPELTNDQIGFLSNKAITYASGRGSDVGPSRVRDTRIIVENWIKEIKINTKNYAMEVA